MCSLDVRMTAIVPQAVVTDNRYMYMIFQYVKMLCNVNTPWDIV